MAELRTIQKSEIRDFTGIRYLLALGDHYAIIPNPLQALGYRTPGPAHQILVVGPSGLHLLSYELIYHLEPPQHFLTLAQELERSAAQLYDFVSRFVPQLPALQLSIVVRDGNIEGEATSYVSFVAWSKVRSRIEESPLQLSEDQVATLLDILKAEVSFQRVDRYHILCELARTPEQTQFLAINTVDDRPVLLREVRLPYDPDELNRNAIIRGAKLAQSLEHPNIVRTEKLIPKEDRFFIVSEWCEGGISLKQYMSDHPGQIPLTTAIQLIKDLCQALMYAHDQGVIHRHLTPENMLVTAEHHLKVFHFDVAKKADMHTLRSTDFKKLTQETPYAAPEYMIGTHQVDQRVDVYAVGVIFYELLTGRKPSHYDESLWEPPSKIIPGLPGYMDQLIARAIRFDKEQRFSTIHAFYSALEKGVSELIGSRYRLLQEAPLKPASKNSLLYQALDEQTGQRVALKKLLIPPVGEHRARQQLLRQSLEPLQALRYLHHPALITLHDTLIEDDDAYVVMNWVEGRDLRDTLQKRPEDQGLLPEEVRQLGSQLADVLDYIHQQGYVHGDIKPENVMRSDGGKITLLDFIPWSKAETGLLLKIPKTMRYMAPELLNGSQTPDEQTDIFALGVLMYELLSHRFPYDIAHLRSFTPGVPCLPDPLSEEIPESLRQVVYKALSTERHARFQRFQQIQAALEVDFALGNTLWQSRVSLESPPETVREIPRPIWWLAGLGLTLALVYTAQTLYLISPAALPVLEEQFYE
ncbi:MAG: serine/threonine protein kinase [Candidatus Sericytochromatia bacterium]|nr:serine/threonine protein kinase [Candidatus Sericytochromatia bacterium]